MTVVVIVAVLLVILAWKSVIVVPEGDTYLVERLGRYDRTLSAGRHVLAPFVDRIAFRYSLLPKEEELSDTYITLDNVPVRVTSTVSAQILDPRQAAYASANAGDFVATIVRTYQRQWIGERSWEDLRESTRDLEQAVMTAAADPTMQVGVRLLALDVKSVERAESQ